MMTASTSITTNKLVCFFLLIAFSGIASAEKTTATMAGYVQLDAYNDSVTNDSRAPRSYDLINFRSIPLDGSNGAEKAGGTKMHARHSRISFTTASPNGDSKVVTKIEGDFFGRVDTGAGTDDDLISNSYEFRLRQAWVKWDNWLAGMAWTNFVDLKAYPEALTVASIVGRPFGRQAQLRYTKALGGGDSIAFSAENPDTDFNKGTPAPGSNAEEDEVIPDLIATYFNSLGSAGHIRLSLLLRQLAVDTTNTDGQDSALDGSATGYGIAASGRVNFGKKGYMKWNLLGGDGIGRYLYNNQFRSSVLTADGLETESAWGGNVSFQVKPSNKFRWNISVGMHVIDVDTDIVTSTAVNKEIFAFNTNAIWTVAPQTTVGVGLTHAEREVESGDTGDITRIMFNVRKNFKATL